MTCKLTDAFDRKAVFASVCWLMFYVKAEGSRVGSDLPSAQFLPAGFSNELLI